MIDEIEVPFQGRHLSDFVVEIVKGSPKGGKEIYQSMAVQNAVNDMEERFFEISGMCHSIANDQGTTTGAFSVSLGSLRDVLFRVNRIYPNRDGFSFKNYFTQVSELDFIR